ncbi:MAG: diadenylate cyclase CdaA [Clostridia bacterium]|nr:diadenylate cyclase CdaA [Clostridia bacterium]
MDLISIFRTVFNVLKNPSGLASIILDILIITIFLYKLLDWTKDTRAYQVMKGIGLLFLFSVFARLFGLSTISWVLDGILASGSIFLILFILFTPELRRVLERIGSHRISKLGTMSSGTDAHRLVQDLKRSILHLSSRRVGALLVFERRSGLGDIAATGIQLNAELSGALIENIFEPNTPLHDGAVLIRDTTVIAASCLLPLSDDMKVSRELGTRHRAALGVSSASDCVVIVVSEETGAISIAKEGKLIRYLDDKALGNTLESLLEKGEGVGFVFPWNRKKKEAEA